MVVPEQKKILFYDRHTSGHHIEYLRYLVEHCRTHKLQGVHMALPQDAVKVFKRKEEEGPILHVITPPTEGSQLKQTKAEGKWLADRVRQGGFTDLFFLNFDPYQYVVGCRFFRELPCRLHGILFSPPHRLFPGKNSHWKESASQWLRRNRKYAQLRWAMRNKNLYRLMVLDDIDGAKILDEIGHTAFYSLPDPIQQKKENLLTLRSESKTSHTKKLLAFGSISPRKNLINIIKSFTNYSGPDVELLIVGKGEESYVYKLKSIAREVPTNDKVNIIITNSFTSDEVMSNLYEESDAIIAVYENFYGSSGALGNAAKFGKPVLVANQGLMAALTTKFNLGVLTATDPRSIEQSIQELLTFDKKNDYFAKEYLKPKTVLNFCETIFEFK